MKRRIRLFSLLMALICALTVLPVMTVTAAADATGITEIPAGATTVKIDGADYTVIRTVDEMNAMTSLEGNVILANDLDYTGKKFTSIALNQHVFDGNGFAMYGFNLSGSGNLQMFSGSNGNDTNVVRNLTVGLPNQKVQVNCTAQKKSVGVIFGYSNAKHLIENVTVYADVNADYGHVGGFCGNVSGTMTIKNSNFYGSVNDVNGYNAGAFLGKSGCSTLTIENCYNYGTVTKTGGNAAGLIGECGNDAMVLTVKNCANLGAITNEPGTAAGLSGNFNVGSVTVENFLNAAPITGKNIAGVIAYPGDNVKDKSITLKNVVNAGMIYSVTGNDAGGIFRRILGNVTLENCVSLGTVSTTGNFGCLYNYGSATFKSTSNVYYCGTVGANETNAIKEINAVSKTTAEGVEIANAILADSLGKTLGKLILNNDGTGAVVANPTFAGVQKSNTTAGKVRLVATLNDSLRYSAVGFEVALVGGSSIDKECNFVYEKLLSTDAQGFAAEVTAAQFGAKYLYALSIENVPTEGTVTITVTPYAKALDGATVYSGASYNLVFVDGALVSVVAA